MIIDELTVVCNNQEAVIEVLVAALESYKNIDTTGSECDFEQDLSSWESKELEPALYYARNHCIIGDSFRASDGKTYTGEVLQ